MNAFLITTPKFTSEWKNSFISVQEEMNNLEKQGFVSNIKVSQFKNSILVKQIIYNYNGTLWESL